MPELHPAVKQGGTWVGICVACVGSYEGLKTIAYRDPVGIPTICFGETRGVEMGDTATKEQCKDMLADRVVEFSEVLQRPDCIGQDAWDRLHDKTKAAVVSLIYNTGPGQYGVKDGVCQLKKVRRPSTLALELRAGHVMAACGEFEKWANPPLPGIIKRRKDEAKMCREGAMGT